MCLIQVDDPLGQIARLLLLRKRFRRESLFIGPVPFNYTEDPASSGGSQTTTPTTATSKQEMELLRPRRNDASLNVRFIKRIRASQILRKAQLSRPKSVHQFVKEETLQLASPELFIAMFFNERRPLNPYRVNRQIHSIAVPDMCRILVQVSSASNLPTRKNNGSENGGIVDPFVEITFQKRKSRTGTKKGQNPQWNEMLKLDIVSDEDLTPETLMESDISTEMIYINVFDELVTDILQDDRTREHFKHERKDNVWLGSVEIPFATVWERSRITGSFEISIPSTLLQYDTIRDSSGHSVQSRLQIYVILDPPLLQPRTLEVQFQSDEDVQLLRYADTWCKTLPQTRHALALCQDMSGKTVFIPRFIRPQAPPKKLETVNEIARFVSLIPFMANRTGFGANCSLWSTTQQVLEVGSADQIEHALILCNFLLYKNLEAWVVLGEDLIDGKTAYVLVKKVETETVLKPSGWLQDVYNRLSNSSRTSASDLYRQNFQIYQPITGRIYEVSDARCSLKEVGSVFNAENV